MNRVYSIALIALITLGCSACVARSPGRHSDSDASAVAFINQLVVVFPAESGTQVQFAGGFARIPADLESELERYFPQVKFRVAEMFYAHFGMDPVKLLLASDRSSGEVLTYLWSLWFARPTTSAARVFATRPWPDQAEFRAACVAVAKLVAFSMDGHAGAVGFEAAEPGKWLDLDRVTVELFNRQGKLWRVMKVYYQVGGGYVAANSISFEQTPKSGGATFTACRLAPNYGLQRMINAPSFGPSRLSAQLRVARR